MDDLSRIERVEIFNTFSLIKCYAGLIKRNVTRMNYVDVLIVESTSFCITVFQTLFILVPDSTFFFLFSLMEQYSYTLIDFHQ